MSREIKFRGKRKDNGKWVYGYLIGKDVIVGEIVDWDSEYFNCEFWRKVDPETVGQYTGRKDMNGKEIYEGMTVSHRRIGDQLLSQGKVSISPSQGVIVDHWPMGFDVEVIGSIHEHPHLLEARSAIGTNESAQPKAGAV